VLQGFKSDRDYQETREILLSFTQQEMINQTIALQSADYYRYLRSKGITIRKTIDMLIATFCITNKHELFHADRDFDAIKQHLPLQVRNPRYL
jgi:predicted nucleic acid-binding protein